MPCTATNIGGDLDVPCLVNNAPDHPRAPEALLWRRVSQGHQFCLFLPSCELIDLPKSAAQAGRERLAALK
jgi:hypothetical protein